MLDFADLVALNKFEKGGSRDALRAVRKQVRRNRSIGYEVPDEALPVFGTIASQFNDDGVSALYAAVAARLGVAEGAQRAFAFDGPVSDAAQRRHPLRSRSATSPRSPRPAATTAPWPSRSPIARARSSRSRWPPRAAPEAAQVLEAAAARAREGLPGRRARAHRGVALTQGALRRRYARGAGGLWHDRGPARDDLALGHARAARLAAEAARRPAISSRGACAENVPGRFPFTAGVFPLKRADEEPKRMFAGEGTPERTNRRFHYLCKGRAGSIGSRPPSTR